MQNNKVKKNTKISNNRPSKVHAKYRVRQDYRSES